MTRILFITATRIGDAVLYSGVLDHLIKTVEDPDITIACGPLAAPLFRATPHVRNVIVMAKKKRGGHWFDLWNQTRTERWDLVVDLRSSITSWFLNAKARQINRRRPGVEHRHRVIEAAQVLGLETAPAPCLWLDQGAIDTANTVLGEGGRLIALSPSAAAPFKEWPADRFAQLANSLAEADGPMPGARIALFGGPGDEARSALLANQIQAGAVIDLTGQLGILETGACLAKADLFIGNDSGLMHMAAAAGTPTLGLFGPTDERVYGPWGAKTNAVRAGGPANEAERGKLRFSDHSLMDGLAFETVYRAACALIKTHQIENGL